MGQGTFPPLAIGRHRVASALPQADRQSGALIRKILITGAGRGIGRATAITCGRRGWAVGVNFLANAAAAAETAADVQACGGQAVTLRGDVAVESEVLEVFRVAHDTLSGLDGVVINAGIVAPRSMLAYRQAVLPSSPSRPTVL